MHDLTSITEQLLKPTATIHVGFKLSLIERKVFNAVIWHSQKSRFAKNSDTLSVALLMSLIGLQRSKNISVIKEALEKLTTNPIIWNTLKKDRTTDWGVCTFLAGAEISGGKLRYVLNPLLAEKVNNPTLFAKIQLLIQTQFISKYSLALYEFLLDDLGRSGNPTTHEVQVSLDTVRHVLQFDGAYKYLNSDVLRPCVREINKHADLSVGYRGVKKGRAIAAILFSIERTAVQIQMSLDDLKILEAGETNTLLPEDALTCCLVEKGVAKHKAKELVETYDEERIRENIVYAENEYEGGKVKNLSAYLIRAIEEDYRPKETQEELRKDEEAAKEYERKAEQNAFEECKSGWKQYRAHRVRERFAALSSDEREERRQAFIEHLQRTNALLYSRYEKEGFGSHLVEVQFFASLSKDLLVDADETNFDAYRQRRGSDKGKSRTKPK